MEDKTLSGAESIQLIARMIQNTQSRFERFAGMPFLIWGYTTLAVSLAVWYLLKTTLNVDWNYLWFAIIPLGAAASLITGRKNVKHVTTYIDRVVSYIWLVVGVSAVLASLAAMFLRLDNILFIEALLLNMGAALTGLCIRLKYVAAFGFAGIVIAFSLLYIGNGIDQILVFAALILSTMILPGHIMNAQGRKLNRGEYV